MPWMRDLNKSRNHPSSDGRHNLAPGRAEAIAKDGEAIMATPPRNKQKQLRHVIDVVNRATRDALNEMIVAHRAGYTLPATGDLLQRHAAKLPKAGRDELRGFLDEVRVAVSEGDAGRPREAARKFTWEISEALVNGGWAPPQEDPDPAESPEALASLIPRG